MGFCLYGLSNPASPCLPANTNLDVGPWCRHPSFTAIAVAWMPATPILSSLLNNVVLKPSVLARCLDHHTAPFFLLLDDSSPLLLFRSLKSQPTLPFLSNRSKPHGPLAKVAWLSQRAHPGWDTLPPGICKTIFLSFGPLKICHSPHPTSAYQVHQELSLPGHWLIASFCHRYLVLPSLLHMGLNKSGIVQRIFMWLH